MNSSTFPTLFKLAMDYLPIQASAVPCERIFSSSAETDTKKRNRINSLLMEALQMLKFHLKKERLNFTESWETLESQMTEDDPDKDLLNNLLEDVGVQDTLDGIMRLLDVDEAWVSRQSEFWLWNNSSKFQHSSIAAYLCLVLLSRSCTVVFLCLLPFFTSIWFSLIM